MELFSVAKAQRIHPPILDIVIACMLIAIQVAPFAAAQADDGQRPLVRQTWLVEALEPQEVARLEHVLEQNPGDISSRIRLLYAYVAAPDNERRARHLLWLIEHAPGTPDLRAVRFVFRELGPLQDVVSYNRAAESWKHQAELHPDDRSVISNAASFLREYYYLEDPFQMERWVLRSAALEPGNREWRAQLALDYALALVSAVSGSVSPAGKQFAAHARAELDNSSDCTFLSQSGTHLQIIAQRPPTSEMLDLQAYGKRLVERSRELGCEPPPSRSLFLLRVEPGPKPRRRRARNRSAASNRSTQPRPSRSDSAVSCACMSGSSVPAP